MLTKPIGFPKKGFCSNLGHPQPALERGQESPKRTSKALTNSPIKDEGIISIKPVRNTESIRINSLFQNMFELKHQLRDNHYFIFKEFLQFKEAVSKEVQFLTSKFLEKWRVSQRNYQKEIKKLEAQVKDLEAKNKTLEHENSKEKDNSNSPRSPRDPKVYSKTGYAKRYKQRGYLFNKKLKQKTNITREESNVKQLTEVEELLALDEEDIDITHLFNIIENLTRHLQETRKIALQENNKYVQTLTALEKAINENKTWNTAKSKYEKLVNDSVQSVQKSQKFLKEMKNITINLSGLDLTTTAPEQPIDEDGKTQEALKRLYNIITSLEKSYNHHKKINEQKLTLLNKEKAQISEQLQVTRNELVIMVQAYKQVMNGDEEQTKLEARLEASTKYQKTQDSEDIDDRETLKEEIQIIRDTFEQYKMRVTENLMVHDENYSNQLNIITELNDRIEALTEECEYLRSHNENPSSARGFVIKEDNDAEEKEELRNKVEEMQIKLDDISKEKIKLLSDLEELRLHINSCQDHNLMTQENENPENNQE